MSSGDFAAELRQSVADHLALIHNAAQAAKTRIGKTVPSGAPAPAPAGGVHELSAHDAAPRPAVNFFAEEPVMEEVAAVGDESSASALAGPAEPLPEGAISFDERFTAGDVDDEGIPMWEDAP